ncbi:5'-nucleotidase C-terminal domain-containing protein [Plebeiibacterium marinum]|uniref:5'-nucleotidase C-terminal domain-containing protein n=1 Tax=Plebeiibacterium marinum TaxID=2992111 RepID=A0AAE3MH77_9BACT|nr:5'-nucleotidase [Plebeiobacterium marinum]MCW3807656.1 5'-nucleotidase C-terminal domain-containing protein [Plebeiobacterium marinum]
MNKHIILLFSIILLCGCKQNNEATLVSGKLITTDHLIANDTSMQRYIQPYKVDIDKKMDRIIGHSTRELTSYFPESPLSNFMSDIIQDRAKKYLEQNKADSLQLISLMNIKGIRTALPKGAITIRHIFEIMPFENEIVILTLSGKNIQKLFEHISTTNGEGISGATITISNNTLSKLRIGGKEIDTSGNYYLATSDYLANGGDFFTMITSPLHSESIGCKIREAIIEHIEELNQNQQKVVYSTDGRIKVIK